MGGQQWRREERNTCEPVGATERQKGMKKKETT